MWNELPLIGHVVFGVSGIFLAFAVAMESWLLPAGSQRKVALSSLALACFLIALILGGNWYLTDYQTNKPISLAGPIPWAHAVVMEIKEHVFFMIVLLALLLPISAKDELRRGAGSGANWVTLGLSIGIVVLGVMMEAMGGIVSLGVRLGLQGGTE